MSKGKTVYLYTIIRGFEAHPRVSLIGRWSISLTLEHYVRLAGLCTVNFVQQFDVEPQFWQFLRGLNLDDLIIELVQNELDAKASHTSITFYPDRLVCEGDGEPVSEDGWRRLAFVMGAGDQVESKRFRIGVKNHGLKACFRLGDEVIIRSDGHRTVQTLYKDGPNNLPSPGTFPEP